MSDVIRVGVVGLGRNESFARAAAHVGMELAAVCDVWEDPGAVMLCRTDNGAVLRIFGLILGVPQPTPQSVARAKEIWDRRGYREES